MGKGKNRNSCGKTSRPGARARTTINLALLLGGLLIASQHFCTLRSFAHTNSNVSVIQFYSPPLYFLCLLGLETSCLSLLMHDVYHQAVPINLRSMFRLKTDVHNYRTRSASNQHHYVEYSRTEKWKIICENWCSDMERSI